MKIIQETPRILKDCKITKLREYSRSYGAPKTITAAYIFEYKNIIDLYTSTGHHTRTFRKETRILISFTGKEIKPATYTRKIKQAQAAESAKKIQAEKAAAESAAILAKITAEQTEILKNYLIKKPETREKMKEIILKNSSKFWRNKIKLQACKIVTGNFKDFKLTPAQIKDLIFSI